MYRSHVCTAAGREILDALGEPTEQEEEGYRAAGIAENARRKAREEGSGLENIDTTADVIEALLVAEAAHDVLGAVPNDILQQHVIT